MSTLYGITDTSGSSTSSFFDSMLGTSSSSSSSTSTLTDYALIRSGAYKKLLSAYYSSTEETQTEEEATAEKVNLTTTQSDAKDLATASSALVSADYSEDNREDIVESIKDYVEAYNSLVADADDVDDTTVLRNTLWLTQQTSAYADTLSEIGITIGEGNELEIDEDKLASADMSTLSSLFSGYSSYASYVTGKASQIYAAASSALNATGTGSAYTSSGNYITALAGSIVDTTT